VNFQAEAGTSGRMSEYRRLIGAGCGGVPPSEVDHVLSMLLEACILRFVYYVYSDNISSCRHWNQKNLVLHRRHGVALGLSQPGD